MLQVMEWMASKPVALSFSRTEPFTVSSFGSSLRLRLSLPPAHVPAVIKNFTVLHRAVHTCTHTPFRVVHSVFLWLFLSPTGQCVHNSSAAPTAEGDAAKPDLAACLEVRRTPQRVPCFAR